MSNEAKRSECCLGIRRDRSGGLTSRDPLTKGASTFNGTPPSCGGGLVTNGTPNRLLLPQNALPFAYEVLRNGPI